MDTPESVIDRLKRQLRQAGPRSWEGIAARCGVAKTLPRKIVYGDRPNPGVQTVQPLLDYFDQLSGTASAPTPVAPVQLVAQATPPRAPTEHAGNATPPRDSRGLFLHGDLRAQSDRRAQDRRAEWGRRSNERRG